MQHTELVIVGVDPGTTVGYAVIDLEGNVLDVKSSKEFSLNSLIEDITKSYITIIVGTDKQKLPSFVDKFAIKVGARIILPDKDLLVQEKRQLIKNSKVKNSHEMDALASALYVQRRIKPLLLKINTFIEENHKEHLAYELKRLVIRHRGINIRTAAYLLEHPQEKEAEFIKKVIEEKKYSEADFFKIYHELQNEKKANILLKQQNNHVTNELEWMRKRFLSLSKQTERMVSKEKMQNTALFKEERLQNILNQTRNKENEIQVLSKEITTLRDFLALQGDYVLVKRLANLGWTEFSQKNKILQIHKGDILLVDDPTIFSRQTLAVLKNIVETIITNKQVNEIIKEELRCDCILSKEISIKEEKYFALVKKDELEKIQNMRGILHKVIDEYKKSRNT